MITVPARHSGNSIPSLGLTCSEKAAALVRRIDINRDKTKQQLLQYAIMSLIQIRHALDSAVIIVICRILGSHSDTHEEFWDITQYGR
jgi:hypothetical protein